MRYSTSLRGGLCTSALSLAASGCLGGIEDPARFGAEPPALPGESDLGVQVPGAGEACPDVVETILASSAAPKGCAQRACHSSEASASGLDLESAGLIARLESQPSSMACGSAPYLRASDVPGSLLMQKIGGGPYPCGGRMPTGLVLTDFEVGCISQYFQTELGLPANPGTDAGQAPDQGVVEAPDAGALDLGAPAPDAGVESEVTIEAEAMSLMGPFQTLTDMAASGGMFVAQTAGDLNADPGSTTDVGRAVFDFTVSQAGPARIFGRVRATDTDSDSFWVRVDSSEYVQWNDLNAISAGAWTWDDVHDTPAGEAAAEFDLQPGSHRLEVVYRETNAQIDRIVITQDPNFQPPAN
ncbi:MAG: hypothetical protein AAFU79_12290 [Myxococcota bacterium]